MDTVRHVKTVIMLIFILLTASLIPAPTIAQESGTTEEAPPAAPIIELWNLTETPAYAWFLNDEYILLGYTNDTTAAEVTYNERLGIVTYSVPVEIRRSGTGEVVWNDTPPDGVVRVAKVVDDGAALETILDLNITELFGSGYVCRYHWPLPQGVLVAAVKVANVLRIYDYNGSLLYETSGDMLDHLVPTLDGSRILYIWETIVVIYSIGASDDGHLALQWWIPPTSELYTPSMHDALLRSLAAPSSQGDVLAQSISYLDSGLHRLTAEALLLNGSLETIVNYTQIPARVEGGVISSDGTLDVNVSLFPYRAVTITSHYVVFASSACNAFIIYTNETGEIYGSDHVVIDGIPYYYANKSYVHVIATEDGNYTFLLREDGGIEVWEWLGGTQMKLVDKLIVPFNFTGVATWGSDPWFPQLAADMVLRRDRPVAAFLNALIYYDPAGDPSYHIYPLYNMSGRVAVVSPSAKYGFIGNKMFLLLLPDPQSGNPRIRLWSKLEIGASGGYLDLGEPLVYAAPLGSGWHAYFFNGSLIIRELYMTNREVELIEDEDVLNGRLWNLYERGLVSLGAGAVGDASARIEMVEWAGNNYTLRYSAKVETKVWLPGRLSVAATTAVIKIPLRDVRTVLDSMMVVRLTSFIPEDSLKFWGVNKAGTITDIAWNVARAAGVMIATTGIGLTIGGIITGTLPTAGVGVALSIAGTLLLGITTLTSPYGTIELRCVVGPALVVTAGARRYMLALVYLPEEEYLENRQLWEDALAAAFKGAGVSVDEIRVGFAVPAGVKTWDDYTRFVKQGFFTTTPRDVVAMLVSEVNIQDIRVESLCWTTSVIVHMTPGLLNYFTGLGAEYRVVMQGQAISCRVSVPERRVTDPQEIAEMLGRVYINNMEYRLVPTPEGAAVNFSIPTGASTLVIDFKAPGYMARLHGLVDICIKKDFTYLEGLGYTLDFHYDWKDTELRVYKIEFVDMWHQPRYVERIFYFAEGTFRHEILREYLRLNSSIVDPESPTGRRYSYVLSADEAILYFDPANGGTLRYCKRFVVNYYYTGVPDAAVEVALNGTGDVSSLPTHAMVVISSTVEQDVAYTVAIRVGYYEGGDTVIVMEENYTGVLHVYANSTAMYPYSIQPFVDAAIELWHQNRSSFLEIIAQITDAPYNYIKANDVYRVVFMPGANFTPPIPPGRYEVTVRVLEYDEASSSWHPSAGASVAVYYGAIVGSQEPAYTAVTDERGETIFTLDSGTWTFIANKTGYLGDRATVPVYDNITVYLYLSPASPPPPTPPVGENVTITFVVYTATNGSPIEGAQVEAILVEPGDSPYYNVTFTATTGSDGVAVMKLPVGRYNVTITAPGYLAYRDTLLFDEDAVVNVALVPETVPIPEYAKLEVRVYYADGRPYEGAHVEVRNTTDGSLIAALATNSMGNATLFLPKEQDYNVSVSVYERVYERNYSDWRIVSLTEDTVVKFTVPWNSSSPPKPLYWLTVEVLWANGLPFHGALVEVYNYSTGELIDELVTNGTGTVRFLLPAEQEYEVKVNATNPYTNESHFNAFLLNLTEDTWITITLPWLPEEPEYNVSYVLWVYAYDAVYGSPVANVTVIAMKGDLLWSSKTNSTGYAELVVPFLGLYNVTGVHPDYYAQWVAVEIVENKTVINLPLTPVAYSSNLTPPLNGTYPPVVINGTPYYWLSVQVLWRDGMPFHGALVTVRNATDNAMLYSQYTNGSGFVHFLLPVNASILVSVNATNPLNASETYYAERSLNMTQHWYIIFTLPWVSKYYTPEVALQFAELYVHEGIGYLMGPVPHLVYALVWTNEPQNITLEAVLYDVETNETVSRVEKNVTLDAGVNEVMMWVYVNVTERPLRARALVNITRYERDTDLRNNALWTSEKVFRPFFDAQAMVVWRVTKRRVKWALLPEDEVQVCIGVYVNIPVSGLALRYYIREYDVARHAWRARLDKLENVTVDEAGIIWRNITITLPWTNELLIYVNVSHPWEDVAHNNAVNTTIRIDPNVRLLSADVPMTAAAGGNVTITIHMQHNLAEERPAMVFAFDEANKSLGSFTFMMPRTVASGVVRAPDNEYIIPYLLKRLAQRHTMVVMVVAYDLYPDDDVYRADLVCTAPLNILLLLLIVCAAVGLLIFMARSSKVKVEMKRILMDEGEEDEFVGGESSPYLAELLRTVQEEDEFVGRPVPKRDEDALRRLMEEEF